MSRWYGAEEAERKRREEEEIFRLIRDGLDRIDDIIEMLPRMSQLRELTLTHCNIDNNYARRLAGAMRNCIFIIKFDIQYNYILELGFDALIDLLIILEYLRAWFPQPEKKGTKKYGNRMSLGNVMKLLGCPTTTDPNSWEIGRDPYAHVGPQRPLMNSRVLPLTSLCLSGMNLSDRGAIIIAYSSHSLQNLQVFYMYDSMVGDVGGDALANQITEFIHLENLYLQENYLTQICKDNFKRNNQLRERTGLSMMEIDLSNQHDVSTDSEAETTTRKITTLPDGTVLDFEKEGKKFTWHGANLIKSANEMREMFGKQKLEIRF